MHNTGVHFCLHYCIPQDLHAFILAGTCIGIHLGDLDLAHEPLPKILQHNAIRASKEGQNVADKVLLIRRELFPMRIVAAEVHLLSCKALESQTLRCWNFLQSQSRPCEISVSLDNFDTTLL